MEVFLITTQPFFSLYSQESTGEVVPVDSWEYNEKTGCVVIKNTSKFHEYTVSFLAYLIWDPVHMYNAVTNDWKDFEHQITFDVRQPKTHKYSMERLRKFCDEHPYVNVIRYTTFFHQFTYGCSSQNLRRRSIEYLCVFG